MKEKIKVALKTKHPGVQAEVIDLYADILAGKITKEEDIITTVDAEEAAVKAVAAKFQSEADRRVTDAIKKRESELEAKHKAEIEALKKAEPTPPKDKDNDMPAWAQALIDAQKKLSEDYAGIKESEAQKKMQSELLTKLKEKEIPESYFARAIAGRTFKDAAEVEAFAAGVETDYQKFQQELVDKGLGQLSKPKVPQTTKEGVSVDVAEYLKTAGHPAGVDGMGSKPLSIDPKTVTN